MNRGQTGRYPLVLSLSLRVINKTSENVPGHFSAPLRTQQRMTRTTFVQQAF
jgi:hypothetical protein